MPKILIKCHRKQGKCIKSGGGEPLLDGDYTVFGEIVEGMDVLEKIALVATDSNDRPKRRCDYFGEPS